MESIKRLREICQLPRKNVDNWHMRHIARKPSIYITWVLLRTPLTATGATFLFLITGLIAALFFTGGTRLSFFIGSLLLQLWYIMDMVDGEIARYKKQTSYTGVYFDYLTHYIVHPIVFVCIGVGLCREYPNTFILLSSVAAGYSFCMITVSYDIFEAVYYKERSKITQNPGRNETILVNPEDGPKIQGDSMLRKAFSILHTVCTFPTAMNIMLLVSFLGLFVDYNLFAMLVIFYSVAATLVWIARTSVFILTKKIDKELAG